MPDERRVAVVTGSGKGLGLEIARELAERGMQVVVTARRQEEAEQAAAGFGADAQALDVADAGSVACFADWARKVLGRVDVLVNNAGVNPIGSDSREDSLLTVDPDKIAATFATNALGALRMCQALVPIMRKRGYGRIVNVSTEMASLAGGLFDDAFPLGPSYRISKVGVNAVTRLLARELKGSDILVNAYSPGWLKTDMGGDSAPMSVAEGAAPAVWLATLPSDGPQGGFFGEMRPLGTPVVLPW